MDEQFYRKYQRVLDILPDVADCVNGRMILAGGTALALFHLKHRVSIDLDFVPLAGDDSKMKEGLKGCLSKKGYRTSPGAYSNQFVIQFEDTSIKIEVFIPEYKIKKHEEHSLGTATLKVASLEDILNMKALAYAERREARDLFDIVFALKKGNRGFSLVRELLKKHGLPESLQDAENMALSQQDYEFFSKVMKDAS